MAEFCGACGQPLDEVPVNHLFQRFDPTTGERRKEAICRNATCPRGCHDIHGGHSYPFWGFFGSPCRRCGCSPPLG